MAGIDSEPRDNNDFGSFVRGPDSEFVVLVSNDGFDFVLKRQFIRPSVTLTQMLDTPGGVSKDTVNYVHLRNVKSLILQRLCQYLEYKKRYTGKKGEDIPAFPIDVNLSVELLLAADFLKC